MSKTIQTLASDTGEFLPRESFGTTCNYSWCHNNHLHPDTPADEHETYFDITIGDISETFTIVLKDGRPKLDTDIQHEIWLEPGDTDTLANFAKVMLEATAEYHEFVRVNAPEWAESDR